MHPAAPQPVCSVVFLFDASAISHLAKPCFLLLEQMSNRRQLLCCDKQHGVLWAALLWDAAAPSVTAALGVPVLSKVLLDRNPEPGDCHQL